MDWLTASLNWYGYVFILGLIFTPITRRIFNRLSFDFGYPFAKVFAILFISYTAFVLGTMKILAFTQPDITLLVLAFGLFNLYLLKRHSGNKIDKQVSLRAMIFGAKQSKTIFIIVFEELLFLISFLFWTYIRSQEPSIRSLEKFMDFGFINSVLRSKYFPPLDIWFSGNNPINYYYFGHLAGATLIKLTNIKPSIGYNLLLATVFGLAITQVFSLVSNIINLSGSRIKYGMTLRLIFFGLLGSFIVNLGGNLHTIYLFTTGYPNENPVPFWQILSGFNPAKYWYPNATRFIPFTIHEFPSYSWVVADLHGHVFDIPFVLLTLAILFVMFVQQNTQNKHLSKNSKFQVPSSKQFSNFKTQISKLLTPNYSLLTTIFLGFLTAIHYMTNAFDGPIYLLLSLVIFFVLFRLTLKFFFSAAFLISSFLIFSLPFSYHFKPFVAGIGVNCGSELFSSIGKIGPFLFEKGNCQLSPLWMLFVLWGFFWISFVLFVIASRVKRGEAISFMKSKINSFIFLLFSFGTFLIIIPEFFYIKDIYPAHFRANTMFKLGYQAFIMMAIAATYVFFRIKTIKKSFLSLLLTTIYLLLTILVLIYPFFSIPSYYGPLNRPVDLDGANWLTTAYPEDKEIIDFLNKNVKDQPTILEAQGDSYTDYERISAMTGLPTVAGWWVHEWLWRGTSEAVGQRIPDIATLYQSADINKTKALIRKYQIKYIVVSKMEKQKYPQLKEDKFLTLGELIFRSSNSEGAIYQIKY